MTTPAVPSSGETARHRVDRVGDALTRRPLLTVCGIGAMFVVAQAYWIVRARHLGSFDVDEAGGLAAALRFHRSLGIDPRPLQQVVFNTRNGPLVPLMSVPLLVVGPRTATTAMVVQPILVVMAACGATGVVASMGHRRAAVLAGVVTMGLSVSIVSSRSYQYSTGVAAFLSLSLWALAASDRGRRRSCMVLFGAAIGAMLLCRTMSIGFVPAAGAAALIMSARDRRAWTNLGLSALSALVVAGPWWLAQWRNIVDYLFENAYGDRARYWGSVTMSARLRDHVLGFGNDFHLQVLLIVAVAVLAGVSLVAWRRNGRPLRTWLPSGRTVAAMFAVVLLGSLAMLSTSNRGFWFAYPLDVILVAGLVGLLGDLPDPGRPWWRHLRTAVGLVALVVVALTLVVSQDTTGPADARSPRVTAAESVIDSLDRLQIGNIDADPRLASSDPEVRRRAAAEWYDAAVALSEQIDSIEERNGPLWQSVTGEIHLFNANTIGLAQEESRIGINGIDVINTLEPTDEELSEQLTPFLEGIPRVLVVVDGRSLPFPDGRRIDRLERLALQRGWEAGRPVPLPDGGDVVVYTHPDSVRAA